MYKLIGSNNIFSLVETVFSNRNIFAEDREWFTNPTSYEYSSSLLSHIDSGVELLLSHIEKGNPIHVQIDRDWDGMTSAATLMNYLFEVFPNINLTWTNHTSKKKHGIEVDLIPDATKLLITPDASSGEYEIHKELNKRGIDILIADHHEASHYSPYAITINNQLDDYPNKELSGAGIVYKLIQCIDRYLGINNSEKYIDLVAFGLIGDGMSTRSKETRWLITKGLNNINNELLKELIKENTEKSEQLTISKVAFKINPKVNSLIRTGTSEELDDFVKALLEHKEITINNRLKTENKRETWARRMTRTCNNTYTRQKKLRDKIMRELENKIDSEKLYENNFIIVEAEGEYNTNMSGYVAMFLVNKYRKPVIILRENSEGALVGSLRGYDPFMKNTKDFLNSLDLFDWCEGHQNACGVQITRENRSLLDKAINEACVSQNFTSTSGEIDVDFITAPKAINLSLAKQLDSYAHIWGKGVEEPLFAVEKLRISARTTMRKPSGYTKWTYNGVDYVIFTGDSELNTYLDKYPNSDLILNVIGSLGMNTFLGKETPQFAIKELEVEEVKNNSFGF